MSIRSISLHRQQYPIVIRGTAIITICMIGLLVWGLPKFINTSPIVIKPIPAEDIDVIPVTIFDQPKLQKPIKPTVVIESEKPEAIESLPENVFNLKLFKPATALKIPEFKGSYRNHYEFPPVAKTKIRPVYPEMALEMGIEGKTLILVFIDKNGKVKKAEIVGEKDTFGFGESAIAAIMQTEFEPALMGLNKIPVRVTMPFTFKIR